MSVLQGTKFVHGSEGSPSVTNAPLLSVKREVMSVEDLAEMNPAESHSSVDAAMENLDEDPLYDTSGYMDAGDYDHYEDDYTGDTQYGLNESIQPSSHLSTNTEGLQRAIGAVQTPFGKRPIIVGQSKSFDMKSEKKIVQWVLERNARDGYVFTDDFKDFARTLYKGSKPFGATQAWMKKFLRRHRTLNHVKFCSKYKNMYTMDEKIAAVVMARKYGSTYASKHTGIGHKMIHSWKLAMDRGQLTPSPSVLSRLEASAPSTSTSVNPTDTTSVPETPSRQGQAFHGIVPEFERMIVQQMKEHQAREGSISYNEISEISQAIYKETRPTFKASYAWIRSFLDRNKEDTKDIEIENVSKVVMEDDTSRMSQNQISEMVDNALKEIEAQGPVEGEMLGSLPGTEGPTITGLTADKRPIVVGPSVMFDRKTEKRLVEWALERQQRDGYVFTDDFKEFAKSIYTGPKRFSASSGWMTLFLRRHRDLKVVKWKSKFKNNYTEEEKMAAIAEAKRLGTGHVGRRLGIDPALICAWRIKLERSTQKQTFWKGTKIRKFGKGLRAPFSKFAPIKVSSQTDAARGIVPEFEQRIVERILEQHEKEGSISYEEMSSISQSIYKETRPAFKASYAWIRNFMKRHESELSNLSIDNVNKVFMPEDEEDQYSNTGSLQGSMLSTPDGASNFSIPSSLFQKRPIIVGQSRSLDAKTEKKLVQWLVEEQAKNGYVFLDQFKSYAQSLYKGSKKFAATQAWRIKFLRRNHAAVKHVKFTSSFKNQYSLEEKKAVVLEAKRLGAAHVSKKTGIDHCLINTWRLKLERSGEIAADTAATPSTSGSNTWMAKLLAGKDPAAKKLKSEGEVGPGLYSHRGIVPKFENKIVQMINHHMDENGSVTYQDVSNIARAVYRETRPHFKASYNWIKEFIKRHKKGFKHVEFEHTRNIKLEDDSVMEILIPEDNDDLDLERYMQDGREASVESWNSLGQSTESVLNPEIVIENAEDPHLESSSYNNEQGASSGGAIEKITKRPLIMGTPVHFDRKTEKKIVEWLLERQARDDYVFTDDLRSYARSLYTGPPNKFAATNAWLSKFLRRNRLNNKIVFQSKLKGNNIKYEEKILQLILEQQQKEGSVSNDDIQKITRSVYQDIRPNFRACYNWIKDFIKRYSTELAGVELENVKKIFIPDDDGGNDGVLVQDYDPMRGLLGKDATTKALSAGPMDLKNVQDGDFDNSLDSSWVDMDSSQASFTESPSTSMFNKRPIIIAPPKSLDMKTEKKLVQWMVEQQQLHGCVYLDLLKQYAKSIHTGTKKFAATRAWMIKFKQRNYDSLKNVVIKSRFRNEYSLEEKIAAVEEARRFGCNHVGRKLGINGGVVYSWKVQIDQAEKNSVDHDLDKGSVRGQVPEFEDRIIELVLDTQATKKSVSYDDVSKHARAVYCETRPNFKASYNWVLEFIRRNRDIFKDVEFENQRRAINDEEKLQILSEEKKYGTDHVVKKRKISASTIYQWKKTMHARAIPIPKFKSLVGNKIKQKYARGKKAQKTYTDSEKRNTVRVAEENGITYASLKLGISRNMIAKWVKYFRSMGEDIVINFTPASTVKKGLEQKIAAWILEQNDQLGIVMTTRIIEYAAQVFEEAYTNISATEHWLETFISQNAEKLEKVRFREKGDTDLEFTDEIKLKISRYAEKYGAVQTANLTGLAPNNIYHWRRFLRAKGYDLSADTAWSSDIEEERGGSSEPKSLMQQKLEKIEQRHSVTTRQTMVAEALTDGTSAIAAKYKIPLPLLLKWMKMYPGGSQDRKPNLSSLQASSKEGKLESGLLKVRMPSMEKVRGGYNTKRYSEDFKRKMCKEAQEIGPKQVVKKYKLPSSTLYNWKKEFGENEGWSSVEKPRSASMERSRSSLESETDMSLPSTPTLLATPTLTSTPTLHSTPIPVQNIKKEPGTFSNTSSNKSGASTLQRFTRTYTEEEKMAVVEKCLEVGAREASRILDVPLSNVIRWTGIFKKKEKSNETYARQKVKRQDKGLRSLNVPDYSDTNLDFAIDNVTATESGTYSSISLSTQSSQQSAAKTFFFDSTRRKGSNMYTDEERYNFVVESDILGSKAIAQKAGVSVDVVYKWRQKFQNRPKQVGRGSPLTSSSRAHSFTDSPTPSESAPTVLKHLNNSSPDVDNERDIDNERNSVEPDDPSSHLEQDVNLQDVVNPSSDNDFVIVENTAFNSQDEFDTHVSKSVTDTSGSVINTGTENLIEMPTIFQLEKSAASKVLEMTTDYLDAEMEHESLFGGSVVENSSKVFSEGNSVMDISADHVTNQSGLGESNSVTDVTTGQVVTPGTSDVSLPQAKGELDFIKIINIKSEASE